MKLWKKVSIIALRQNGLLRTPCYFWVFLLLEIVFVYSSPSIVSTSTWNGSVFLSMINIPTVRVVAPESLGIQPADHPINWKSKSLKPISYDLKLILHAPPTHNLWVGGVFRIALHLPELICQWDFFLPHHSTSHTSWQNHIKYSFWIGYFGRDSDTSVASKFSSNESLENGKSTIVFQTELTVKLQNLFIFVFCDCCLWNTTHN